MTNEVDNGGHCEDRFMLQFKSNEKKISSYDAGCQLLNEVSWFLIFEDFRLATAQLGQGSE
jgi:hypothetical protein